MIFSSLPFFAFFVVYFPLHLFTPRRYRIYLILTGSIVFYAYYRISYLAIPIALTALAYGGALWVENAVAPAVRRSRLAATIAALLVPLLFYKYTNFIITSVLGPFFGWKRKLVNLPLPLGISFFTFTLISYVIDVYKERFPLERQFRMLLAYVLYFPHQIAGPILKPVKLIPQLAQPRDARHARFAFGAMLFAVGLVKKVILADSISPRVDAVYASGALFTRADYALAFYGFPLQIYCDFSGYTDMALGLAFMLGVRLPTNFKRPYSADSLVDFWRRWHITFSLWLRDYLYIPLGGTAVAWQNRVRNIFITMLLGGLWHGANWTFVVWGAIHAVGIASYHLWRHFQMGRFFGRFPRWARILITFHLVSVAWIFFRAPDFATALRVLAGLFTAAGTALPQFMTRNAFPLLLLAFFYATHRYDDFRRWFLFVRRAPRTLVWITIASLILLAVAFNGGNSAAFIYFDF